MDGTRNLLDRYAAGTTSLVVHGAVVGVMLLLFQPVPKPIAATLAITMPSPS